MEAAVRTIAQIVELVGRFAMLKPTSRCFLETVRRFWCSAGRFVEVARANSGITGFVRNSASDPRRCLAGTTPTMRCGELPTAFRRIDLRNS